MTERSKLHAFLLALQTSRSVQLRYKRDPVAEMTRFDLSPRTIEAVQRGDEVTLWRIVTRTAHGGGQVGAVVGAGKTYHRRKSKQT